MAPFYSLLAWDFMLKAWTKEYSIMDRTKKKVSIVVKDAKIKLKVDSILGRVNTKTLT